MATRVQIGEWGNTGKVYITPGAAEATAGGREVLGGLMRHVGGDLGRDRRRGLGDKQRRSQERGRILSAYPIDPEKPCAGYGANCLWIITEADRSVTTILLPDEY